MRLTLRLIAVVALVMASFSVSFAAEPINTLEKSGFFGYKPNGVAIRGYDTVAYFTMAKPVKGSEQFSTQWEGAEWRFSSDKHLQMFLAEPERYAPQYGGYCAYGVAGGDLVKIEPELWAIVDDKLYLNYNKKIQHAWEKDIGGYIATANNLFSELLNSE